MTATEKTTRKSNARNTRKTSKAPAKKTAKSTKKNTKKSDKKPVTLKERADGFKPTLKTNHRAKPVSVMDFATGKKRFSVPTHLRKRSKTSKEVTEYVDVSAMAEEVRKQSLTKRSIVEYGWREAAVDTGLVVGGAAIGAGLLYALSGGEEDRS